MLILQDNMQSADDGSLLYPLLIITFECPCEEVQGLCMWWGRVRTRCLGRAMHICEKVGGGVVLAISIHM